MKNKMHLTLGIALPTIVMPLVGVAQMKEANAAVSPTNCSSILPILVPANVSENDVLVGGALPLTRQAVNEAYDIIIFRLSEVQGQGREAATALLSKRDFTEIATKSYADMTLEERQELAIQSAEAKEHKNKWPTLSQKVKAKQRKLWAEDFADLLNPEQKAANSSPTSAYVSNQLAPTAFSNQQNQILNGITDPKLRREQELIFKVINEGPSYRGLTAAQQELLKGVLVAKERRELEDYLINFNRGNSQTASMAGNTAPPAPASVKTVGALLQVVDPGSVAEIAGLRVGDVIVKMRGVAVTNSEELKQLLKQGRPWKSAAIEFMRGTNLMRTRAYFAFTPLLGVVLSDAHAFDAPRQTNYTAGFNGAGNAEYAANATGNPANRAASIGVPGSYIPSSQQDYAALSQSMSQIYAANQNRINNIGGGSYQYVNPSGVPYGAPGSFSVPSPPVSAPSGTNSPSVQHHNNMTTMNNMMQIHRLNMGRTTFN